MQRHDDNGVMGGNAPGFRYAAFATLRLSRFSRHVIFLLCLLPLLRLLALAFTGGLGVNPIEFVTRSLGTWTLTLLLLTLAVTPLRRLSGYGQLLRYRRMLGLFVFFYAVLHVFSYLWFDQFFALGEILRDIAKRPFITVGVFAFSLLIPLAATSNDRSVRALKRNWQRLHRLVYPAAIAAVTHYYWLVKKDTTLPMLYALALTLLLLARVVWRRSTR